MTHQACIVKNLSVQFTHEPLFQQLNFQLPYAQCSALIGRNGQGKSVLMSLLTQAQQPSYASGEVNWQTNFSYLTQLERLSKGSIAEALDVAELYTCFQRIEQATASFEDYDQVEHAWHQPIEWQQLLESANLPTDLSTSVEQLSEGQKTQLALCRLFLRTDDYLLLDEPSNHLDSESREWLSHKILQHPSGCLVISHDRKLLNQISNTFVLNDFGLHYFHCHYAEYQMQVEQQTQALQRDVTQEKRELKQRQIQQHEQLMKAQKRQKMGQKLRDSGSQAKILLDFKKERASQTQARMAQQQLRQKQQAQQELKNKQQQLEQIKSQRFIFNFPQKQTGEILRLKDVVLPYFSAAPISLALRSGEKIQLRGRNGSGKSTLLRIIQGDQLAQSGEIFKRATSLYLDQTFSLLQSELNAISNIQLFNISLSDEECRNQLGQLRIRRDKSLLPVSALSGGEQLKVALLCIRLSTQPVDLLLLDEPENHLDIESKLQLAQAIHDFKGAVILVSHDEQFVEDSHIQMHFDLTQSR